MGQADGGDATTSDSPVFTLADAALDSSAGEASFDGAVLDGGGLFVCFGCICDGTDRFCYSFVQGDMVGDAGNLDASLCTDASTTCIPYPAACATDHSCACLYEHASAGSCVCQLDPSGEGLELGCGAP